ncbi:hypothetical protein STEG23_014843 [Scotinomys teguina]
MAQGPLEQGNQSYGHSVRGAGAPCELFHKPTVHIPEHPLKTQEWVSKTESLQFISPPLHRECTGACRGSPPLYCGCTGACHGSPPLHRECTGACRGSPPLHRECTGACRGSPPLHRECTGACRGSPPLHHECTGACRGSPPLHRECTGACRGSPPLHRECTGACRGSPPLHRECTGACRGKARACGFRAEVPALLSPFFITLPLILTDRFNSLKTLLALRVQGLICVNKSAVFCGCGSDHTFELREDASVALSEGHFPEKVVVVSSTAVLHTPSCASWSHCT